MANVETLRIRRFERCDSDKPEYGLNAGDYFYVVKSDDPSRIGKNYRIKTYRIQGNDTDNHPSEIRGYWSDKMKRFVHLRENLLKILYSENKFRTFENIQKGEEPSSQNNPSGQFYKLRDTGCNYVYTHHGELPDPSWAVGETREVSIKLNASNLEFTVLHEKSRNPIQNETPIIISENWVSPKQLFSKLDKDDRYDELFVHVLNNANNERVSRPEKFIKDVHCKQSSWIFEYINYLLGQYIRSIKNNYRLIQELCVLTIKIEKLICSTPDLLQDLGVTDRFESAEKAKQVIYHAQILNKAAGLLEEPENAVSLFNEMTESLMNLGQILEDPEINTEAFIEAIRMNSQNLVKEYPLPVIELTNALFYRHKLTSDQKSRTLRPLMNELLWRYSELSDQTIILLGTLVLLLDDDQTITESESKAVLYLVLYKICRVCDKGQKTKAISSLVSALETGQKPTQVFCWECFNKIIAAAKSDTFPVMITEIAESLEDISFCYEILTEKLEESVTKYENTRDLNRFILLSAIDLCCDNIEVPSQDKIGLLMLAINISTRNNDQASVTKYRSLLNEYRSRLAEEEARIANEKAEAEKQSILSAIKHQQEQISKNWNQLYAMAVSLKATNNTLQAIVLNKEFALNEVEKEIRQDYAYGVNGLKEAKPAGVLQSASPDACESNYLEFNLNGRFDLAQFCKDHQMDRNKDHTSFIKVNEKIYIFLARSLAAGLDLRRSKNYEIPAPDFDEKIGIEGIAAEILSSNEKEIIIFKKEDRDIARYFDRTVCTGKDIITRDRFTSASLRLKFKSLERF